jgi:hypothetical protein
MENKIIEIKERISTKSVHIYPSEKSNCGILPDENGLIFQFGETKELYPPKYIKILVSEKIEKEQIALALRQLADILEGKKELQYEQWFLEQTAEI